MGEDDDDEGYATEDIAAAAPEVATEEEEDPKMLISEWESPKALEIILSDDMVDPTLDDYNEEEWYPNAND
jgi:hypothetical protein